MRYADDFVIFCESKEDAESAKQEIDQWLGTRGLALSEEKTKVVYLTEGFDFLGFNVRHYRTPLTSKSGWKLLITPSKKAVQKFKDKLRAEWLALKGRDIAAVLARINPILRGWSNYYRTVVSKATFNKLDTFLFGRCVRFVRHAHPTKPWKWVKAKYFGQMKNGSENRWVFGDKRTGAHLLMLNWTPIKRHALVPGRASPDDPSLQDYWTKRRQAQLDELPPKWVKLARRQKGVCPNCRRALLNDEELHVHHMRHRRHGGTDDEKNLRLVHMYCHQQAHHTRRLDASQLA